MDSTTITYSVDVCSVVLSWLYLVVEQVLNFFNASIREYSCIFTSGATAALKLIGETFPWSNQSRYMYTMENHNSVLGIREYPLVRETFSTKSR